MQLARSCIHPVPYHNVNLDRTFSRHVKNDKNFLQVSKIDTYFLLVSKIDTYFLLVSKIDTNFCGKAPYKLTIVTMGFRAEES